MINFLKYRNLNLAISVSFIVVAGIAWYFKGINYSIDFEGGTQVLFGFSQPVKAEELRSVLASKGYPGVITREFGPTEVLARVKEFVGNEKGAQEQLRLTVQEAFPGNEVTLKSVDSVGPAAGAAMRLHAVYAVLLGLLLMLLYIMFRFEFSFAVGAVLSLFHDALTIVGAFILLGKEISPNVIVAVLTILGYSINDTIVIFNRIRENIKKLPHEKLYYIVNLSTNQTLTRTILTSFATLLSVVSFLVLGGESLHDLALALFIGIAVGTYSSIYVASPIMMMIHKHT